MGKDSRSKKAHKQVETCPSFRSGHLPADEDVLRLRTLTAPHVDSYNYFLDTGLQAGINDIEYAELDLGDEKTKLEDTTTVQFWVENVNVAEPTKRVKSGRDHSFRLLPRECRERRLLYAGEITGDFCYRFVERRNGAMFPGKTHKISRSFGDLPIMVGSSRCHLQNKLPAQLQNEFGGYFIVSGIERCIRMLQIPRRNYATAIQRSNYKNRGPTYSDLGIAIRCSRYNGDQSSITNTVHYLTTGGASLKFTARKQEFLIPMVVVLRALSETRTSSDADVAAGSTRMGVTDEELYKRIVQGDNHNTFLVARVGLLLQDARARYGKYNTPEECLAFLGARFRRLSEKADTTPDVEIGRYIIRKYVLIHLRENQDKLECALFLLRKLYSFAAGDCGVDNSDSLQNQELLLPGHLMSAFVKEKFEEFLRALREALITLLRRDQAEIVAKMQTTTFWNAQVQRHSQMSNGGIGKKVAYFLSTGNIVSQSGLDLMQVSGYTIVAERLNFLRYCAHFRSVHRGSFFMEMKTTAVRKLLPDQWGFLCPVHTPDGGPCGLLSHLALKTIAMSAAEKSSEGMDDLDDILISLGVTPCGAGGHSGEGRAISTHTFLPVLIDGRVMGGASPSSCKSIVSRLRILKVSEPPRVPPSLEVAMIPPGTPGAPYPGLYLFTEAARIVRPVLQLATGKTELIGPLEQAFMDIACLEEDIREGITTHIELDPTNMLSLIASLTPFSDQNQSPRNMYQCQMGKQTMGTPCHALLHRPDNKLYRLKTPQAPIVQTSIHGKYKMDEYPNGTNAVVAVLSYTGFDMEDAMILNKGSYHRGFGHASVYKSFIVDLREESKSSGASVVSDTFRLGNKVKPGTDDFFHEKLEADGLPKVNEVISEGDKLYCIVDSLSNWDKAGKHKDRESAYVQDVRLIGDDSGKAMDNKACVTLRFPRNPVVGDKFSSRHGQKGVLSILWPQEDMPFSESGISPDIIINPHAFPSRMTIGMLVESMAGKSGALHGTFQDATPFTFHESGDKVSVDYFGEQLQAAGYNYYGSEALYSGLSGCAMHADLYIGIVYYQRLRHMVSDKYQVRATGPVNELTRQPIKGRKKGGGIRLGEMERDSLLSHGCAFLLQDRLLNCSDRHVAYVCTRCGDLLMSTTERCLLQTTGQSKREAAMDARLRLYCRTPSCRKSVQRPDGDDDAVEPIVLPYVYRYLVNELAGMNIKVKLDIK